MLFCYCFFFALQFDAVAICKLLFRINRNVSICCPLLIANHRIEKDFHALMWLKINLRARVCILCEVLLFFGYGELREKDDDESFPTLGV